MKRSAALTTFITAWILFAVVGIQYSLDQQKRAELSTQNQNQIQAMAKLDDGVVTPASLDREKNVLEALAVVACGFMAGSLALYRAKVSEQPAPRRITQKAA
jgi:asparagine N-glycosylation enzyme membrane subunit Stt3